MEEIIIVNGVSINAETGEVLETAQPFTITDDKAADWAVRTVLAEEADAQRLADLCKQEASELLEKAKAYIERGEKRTSFLKSKLAEYASSVEMKETKTQRKYELPHGTIMFKQKQPTFLKNEEVAINFLEASGFNIYVEEMKKLKWGEVKKEVTIKDGVPYLSGLKFEGIDVQENGESFEIKG